MYPTKTLTGKDTIFRRCERSDVERHFERIVDAIEPKLKTSHVKKMLKCVQQETAFVTAGDECFLYYEKTKPAFADGVSIYGKGNPNLMIAMMCGIFKICDLETRFIYIRLHAGKNINEYKGLLSKTVIRRHRKEGDKLLIRTDHLLSKFEKLNIRSKHLE